MNKKLTPYRVIYCIKNLKTNVVYIGSAENYWNRIYKHRSDLRSNIHSNIYLQNSWNKYGENCFIFGVIEELTKTDNIIEREQYWMDYYNVGDKTKCFNLKIRAYSNLNYKYSEESKLKMSIAKKNKPWTEKQREVFSNKKRSKRPHCLGINNVLSKPILQYTLNLVFIKEWESINICSKELNLHNSNIIMCLKNKIKQTGGYIFRYKE